MTLRVAFPGLEGAHAAAAAEQLFPTAELVPVPTFPAVAAITAAGEVDHGVMPIESSLSGPVAETHDILHEAPLSIVGETVLPIRHLLVGVRQVALEEIRVVRSHVAALDQCRQLLASMPWATAIAAGTTAQAAAEIAERGDAAEVAIASEKAADLYGLEVIRPDVGDHPEAYTRFVSLARYTRLDEVGHDRWRLALTFITDHRPGALVRAIEPFARHSLDLVQLVSRPIPHDPFDYRFDAVLAGHPQDPLVRETLAEVRAATARLRVFGSYPAAPTPD